MDFLKNLEWRYATKKFDSSKKVSEDDISYIRQSIRLSPSSYGLQPYKIIEVTDPEIRKQLKPLSRDHSQVTDASNLFIFCNFLEVSSSNIDDLITLKAKAFGVPEENLSAYVDFIKEKLQEKSPDELIHWTAKQTYIALASGIYACAEKRIDCTPMEGFDTDAVNNFLQLKGKGLNACVMLAIGYRHAEDRAQFTNKVRKSIDTLFDSL